MKPSLLAMKPFPMGASASSPFFLNPLGFAVVDELRRDLRATPSLDAKCLHETSRRMGMSPRTLQRRLDELGTSFSAELSQARKERALELVTMTKRPLAGVAKELGFADPSTFSRAFQRWFARAPSALRARSPL